MRKSGQQRLERPAKRKKSVDVTADATNVREGDGFVSLSIPPCKSVVFEGSAVLEVISGCISVYGALVTAQKGPVKLTASSKHGRALLLTAVTAESQAPLAASTAPVQAVLHAVTGCATTAARGFTVVDRNSASSSVDGKSAVWQVPQQWSQTVDTLSAAVSGAATEAVAPAVQPSGPLVIAVTGSKGCGKSALARLLVNSLLNSCPAVSFMDLDPGQPELTPAGLLSLHVLHEPVFGPAHMQQQQPLTAYFQGDVSSQSEPGRYLQAVQALCARYYSMTAAAAAAATGDHASQAGQAALPPPLVINTPGWITGLGLELLGEVLRCAGPSHVLNLQTSNSKKNLPDGCWWLDSQAAAGDVVLPTVLQLPSCTAAVDGIAAAGSGSVVAAAASGFSGQSGDTVTTANPGSSKSNRSISAVEARALSMLAWAIRAIHNSSSNDETSASSQDSTVQLAAAEADLFSSVAAGLAAAVPFEVSLQDIKLELLHAQVAYSELGFALNGALVGLNKSSSSDGNKQQLGAADGLQECLGLGLVRAVDGSKRVLYVLTDLSEVQLQDVDTLVVGRLELPDKLQVCQTFASPYQGLYCMTSTATGAGVIKSRNNLLRASLMRT